MAVLARLKRGISPAVAHTEMAEIARQLAAEFPEGNANWSAKVVPLNEEMTGKYQTPLYVLLGAVAVVLLIACANVANLLLTRAVGKQRDVTIRLALGATRWNLIRQMLAESMTLAVAGGLVGLALGYMMVEWLKQFGPRDLRRLEQASLDWTVIGYTVGVALLTGLALGVVPAVVKARSTRLRDAFTVAEVALSLILLAGAGLLLKSFTNLMAVDPGFRSERVLTLDLSLPGAKYRDQKGVDFFRELTRRVRALPGVESASNITFLPFKGPGAGTYFWRADRPQPAAGQEPVTDVRMIQPGYFETLKIPLVRGRLFGEGDNQAETPLCFVINEELARSVFPGEDPLGKRLRVQMGSNNGTGEIVGVVGNVKHTGLDGTIRPMVYYPQAHLFFNFGTLVARTAADPSSMAKPIAGIVREMDPELAISEVGTMQGWIEQSVARPKFQAGLLAGFAALALVLAAIGIYGVISFAVAQRTREIGVRMALGARPGDIAGVVLKRSATLAGIGLGIGIAGTLALGRYVKTLLFGVEPADLATITLCAAGLFAIALAASYVPARRAGRVDPMVSLRHG
jgi:putative ABC transport system permease protein